MKTIVIDPGHGGNDPGASYQDYVEKSFNLQLALKIRENLRQNYEARVLMTRTKDQTVSLDDRTDFANNQNADYFCSIHHNAGGGSGFESYIYNGGVPRQTVQAQDTIHQTITQRLAGKYNISNRGQKRANFHVLRETKMSAILLEMLFIDSEQDRQLLTKPVFREEAAAAIAAGIAEALSLPRAPQSPLYHVIAGSFKNKQNAQSRVAFLKQQQIEAIIQETQISGETYYRVQAGAFRKRANAKNRMAELKRMGIGEPFIVTTPASQAPKKTSKPDSSAITIRGETRLTAADMDQFAAHLYSDAPKLGKFYETFGNHYGIRGDIAFAQALHETDNFRFTGVVNPEQHNYGGLGATGPNQSGASFPTPEKGVLAHIQHLYAYAATKPLPEGYSLIDPRFKQVTRGSAKTWTALNGKWAVPGNGYGQSILRKYQQMMQFAKKDTSRQTLIQNFFRKLWQWIKQALLKLKL